MGVTVPGLCFGTAGSCCCPAKFSPAGGVVAHMHQVSAIGLYRCLCIPMRMSARKGLSYGRLPDRSVCNNLT